LSPVAVIFPAFFKVDNDYFTSSAEEAYRLASGSGNASLAKQIEDIRDEIRKRL
jgi:hypothetical protein